MGRVCAHRKPQSSGFAAVAGLYCGATRDNDVRPNERRGRQSSSRGAADVGAIAGMTAKPTVLVTGGSGFVGSHVLLQLLNAGYSVRTTVRSLDKTLAVRAMLTQAGAQGERL